MAFFVPGMPRIRLLNADGTTNKTLWLPPPDRDKGTLLEFEEEGILKNCIGARIWLRRGWYPNLTLVWKNYNDVAVPGYTVGAADGNVASFTALLAILDAAPGRVKISPGPSAGGFVVNETKISPIGVVGPQGIAQGVEIQLKGGTLLAAKALGTF
jgi:hypothetical protein